MSEDDATGMQSRLAGLAVVVVNYGSSELLEQNLAPLSEQLRSRSAQVQVVVVDNFSSLTEQQRLARLALEQGWQLISLAENRGFGAATNLGLERAAELGAVSFLLLNPDAFVSADVVVELYQHSQRRPADVICPRIENSAGGTYFAGSDLSLATGQIRTRAVGAVTPPRFRAWLTGACLMVHRDLLVRSGGFDESYFLYWEDVDLTLRAQDHGGRLVVRPDLLASHDEGGTQGERVGRAKSDTYYYYNCRNRLLFATRYLGRRDLARWLLMTPGQSWQILLRGGRRQLLHSPRPLLATVRGSLAGIGLALRALLSPTRTATTGRWLRLDAIESASSPGPTG
jgi:GT2 family glycosyltransferase